LEADTRAALAYGSEGFVMFRYGLINANFSPKPIPQVIGSFNNEHVVDAAIRVKNYVETNQKLPDSVNIDGI
jgi:hypothetical protein